MASDREYLSVTGLPASDRNFTERVQATIGASSDSLMEEVVLEFTPSDWHTYQSV